MIVNCWSLAGGGVSFSKWIDFTEDADYNSPPDTVDDDYGTPIPEVINEACFINCHVLLVIESKAEEEKFYTLLRKEFPKHKKFCKKLKRAVGAKRPCFWKDVDNENGLRDVLSQIEDITKLTVVSGNIGKEKRACKLLRTGVYSLKITKELKFLVSKLV